MPQNGETNWKFGFFKNVCCGKEIVVPESSEFPACPDHPGVTIWKAIVDENTVRLGRTRNPQDAKPRFNVGEQVNFIGFGLPRGAHGTVIEVIESPLDYVHRYEVCFDAGWLIRCFGFELESSGNASSKSA